MSGLHEDRAETISDAASPWPGTPLSMHDPRTIGRWQLHSRLGAGGMGVVFFATSADQVAALKVIRPGLLESLSTRDRFRREVDILRSVTDDHICRYVDADLESDPAWLALEYLPGAVLRDEISNNGPLGDALWWQLASGIAQALIVLEAKRVTHRDLKPGNVILADRGPVLIDFGIAHPEDATQLTATGLVTGSPAWLAPEQANLEPTGPATDIFTFGSLLAFAATGRPPFGEGASVAVLMSIIQREPDLDGIDAHRAQFLIRMMVKNPAFRPNAREVFEWAKSLAPEHGHVSTRDSRHPASGTRSEIDSGTEVENTPREVGPRTAAARNRRRNRRRMLGSIATAGAAALLALGIFGNPFDGSPGPLWQAISSAQKNAPSAPTSDVLVADQWLLESYRLQSTGSGLEVSGTVRNQASATRSANLRVWMYSDEKSLGSVSTSVTDIPPGGSVTVQMQGDAIWHAGPKTVLLQVD